MLPLFDPNIGEVYKFWLHMRLPTGRMLRDGHGFSDHGPASLGLTPLLAYAYTGDPIIEGDFLRQNGMAEDPIPILLLNDPGLAPEASLASAAADDRLRAGPRGDDRPHRLESGPEQGRRGGQEEGGGGYHFGNHQHSDAGSFQIDYRGLQAVDLGQYRFYGTPYDMGFRKRSVLHNMMFAVDPQERFPGTKANDGGTRFVRACPATPRQAMTDPAFANGQRISAP